MKEGLDKCGFEGPDYRPRLSREAKAGLYEKWKKSGLSKSSFCRREGLSLSLFYKWCVQVVREERRKEGLGIDGFDATLLNGSMKLRPVELVRAKAVAEPMALEVSLPGEVKVRLSVEMSAVGQLLRELIDATNPLR